MKNPIVPTIKFVRRHRVAIAVVATTTVCAYLHQSTVKEWNGFLEDKDLYNEYYHIGEDD